MKWKAVLHRHRLFAASRPSFWAGLTPEPASMLTLPIGGTIYMVTMCTAPIASELSACRWHPLTTGTR